MYTVGMDVDTQVSVNDVSYLNEQGYMLETSLYIVLMIQLCLPNKVEDTTIYPINYPNKSTQACLNQLRDLKYPLGDTGGRGKISIYWPKNNQQETYIAQNLALKLTTLRKIFYSTSAITSHHPKLNRSDMTESDFGYYLAGLIEGDGHFSERLEIIFHEEDIASAQFIRTKIGYGSIYKVKDKKAYKLSIGSEIAFIRLHKLLDGKFVGDHKVDQFNKNNYDLILRPGTKSVTLDNS